MSYLRIIPRALTPFVVILLITCLPKTGTVAQPQHDKFKNLPKLLRSSGKAAEFLALTDFEDEYQQSAHDASIEYLKSHPQLVQRIREDLGSEEIHWQLERLAHRLIYAPESRTERAGLFADYCLESINDLMTITGLVNPYSSISTRLDKQTDSPEAQGIKAVIVSDLAEEYKARYQFSGTGKKRIEIGLSGRITVNEVGSYSSYLHYSPETASWKFSHDRHTVWKIMSANPYTVLMTPLEETLHIALREHTERMIMAAVAKGGGNTALSEVRQTVEEWMAVEEAVVGGLVYQIVPDVMIKRIPDLPREWIEADLNTKDRFPKYRHLRKAIALVQNYGPKKTIELYTRDPNHFRDLLTQRS